MKSGHLLLTALMAAQTSAQTSNLLSILASEAYSVFTSFTADQPPRTSAESTTSTSTSSSASQTSATLSSASSTSFSSDSSTTTSAETSSSITSSSTFSTSQTGSAAAASTSNATVSSNSSSSNHNRTIAIVLGTVLGALALGLLILVLLLLLRRRRLRRGTVRDGYISPSSESTFETHKGATSRITPVKDPNISTGPKALHTKNYAGAPLMSERSNHDMPFPHEFHDSNSRPYIPETDNGRKLLYKSAPGHTGTWFDATDGLNSHPVRGHDLDGSGIAAGLGGAALGVGAATAATRRSRHREKHDVLTPPEKSGRHPQYLDGPYPSRSPRRSSADSTKRRSGSMHRTSFHGSQDHLASSLSNKTTRDETGSAITQQGLQNHDRGREVSTTRLSRNQGQPHLQFLNSGQGFDDALLMANHGPHEMSAILTPPIAKGNVNPLDGNTTAHRNANVGHAAGNKIKIGPRSSSQPRSYPPLPPALTIPQATRAQPPRIPSRSPKRARFADKDTYHEPVAYDDTHSLKSSNISSPAQSSPWIPRGQTMPANAMPTDGLVSPISPEDTRRSFDHGIALAPARANLVHIPRSRDPSPNPPTQPSTRSNDPFVDEPSSKPHSGLVDAVQTHFHPAQPESQPPTQRPHHLYTLFPTAPSTADSRNHRALTRKPVPSSNYNVTKPANTSRPSNENWWRGSGAHDDDAVFDMTHRQHEDSAWANNYSNNVD